MWTYRMEDLKNTWWSQICCKFVSLSVWPDWYNSGQIRIHCEDLRKLDCIDFVVSITAFSMDADDIFNPQLMEWQTWRTSSRGSAVAIPLVLAALNYFWGGCGVKDEPLMMEMLRLLYSHVRQVSGNTKSVRRTWVLLAASVHDATCKWAVRIHVCLMPGYKVNRIPLHGAYLRMHLLPPNVIILHDLQGVNTLILIFQTLILFHLLHWSCNLTCYLYCIQSTLSVSCTVYLIFNLILWNL